MTDSDTYQVHTAVIGAGIVGLAVARELAKQGHEVLVLEAGAQFGEGVSSRNSEVVHAGIYYPEGSLKAELCVQGRQQLYDFCETRQLPFRKCGKWIVAQEQEAKRLEAIMAQAERNGVGLRWFDGLSLGREVPGLKADAALFSPETGIVNSHAVMLALLGELEDAGGHLVYQAPVERVITESDGYRIQVGGKEPCWLRASRVVNSAGLDAVSVARNWEGLPEHIIPRQYFARGMYFSYSGQHPFQSLIYPVPEPGGLGIHLTLDLAGQARFGPDVAWVDEPDYTVDSRRAMDFSASVRRWWPDLDEQRLQPAYAGVRPKLHGPGEAFADFQIQDQGDHGLAGVVNLFGIESPGLTASLAIAGRVSNLLKD